MIEETAQQQHNSAENIRQWRFPKGVSGNPKGRPVGTISPIKRIKEIFRENPNKFDKWIVDYMEDKSNRKHVVEMIDGKPAQAVDITSKGEQLPTPILNVQTNNNTTEDTGN